MVREKTTVVLLLWRALLLTAETVRRSVGHGLATIDLWVEQPATNRTCFKCLGKLEYTKVNHR